MEGGKTLEIQRVAKMDECSPIVAVVTGERCVCAFFSLTFFGFRVRFSEMLFFLLVYDGLRRRSNFNVNRNVQQQP